MLITIVVIAMVIIAIEIIVTVLVAIDLFIFKAKELFWCYKGVLWKYILFDPTDSVRMLEAFYPAGGL